MIETTVVENLKELGGRVETMKNYLNIDTLRAEIEELERLMAVEGFWNDRERSQAIIDDRTRKKHKVDRWARLSSCIEDAETLAAMAMDENDEAALKDLEGEFRRLSSEVKTFELSTLLTDKYDAGNAILSVHAGAGGTEAQDWAEMIMRMYTRWMEVKGLQATMVDTTPGEEAGVKSVVIEVKGENAYGFLSAEKGIHRLVRISPFDSNKRRHTSFCAVDVIPEIEDDVNVEIDTDDLKIDTYRSSGAGGQHVNKTSSAVRITHMPTGIVVQCQNERSQHKNKDMAMKILRARLFELRRRQQEEKVSQIQGELKDIAWGSQIRSYVFHPYTMVKDLRTEYKTGNVQAVMDGDLDDFIWHYLKFKAAEKAGVRKQDK